MTPLRALLLLALVPALLPATAVAAGGSVQHDAASGVTTFTDGPGPVRVRMSPRSCAPGSQSARCVTFTSAGDALATAGGCSAETADAVVCPLTDTYRVRLGGGNDRFTFASGGETVAYERLTISGGPGDDAVAGGPGDDRIAGGPGNDQLVGDDPGCNWGDTNDCGGADVVSGGAGDDVIDGGRAGDRLSGGRGDDRIAGDSTGCTIYDPRCGGADVASGGPGADVIVGGPGDDRIAGGTGDDRMTGDDPGCTPWDPRGCSGDDDVSAGPGDDLVVGGFGTDRLSGGPGRNRVVPGGCNVADPWCN